MPLTDADTQNLQNLARQAAAWWCDVAMSDLHDASDILRLGLSAEPSGLIALIRDSWRKSNPPLDAFRADLEATVLDMLTRHQSLVLWMEYDAQYTLREVCKRTGMPDALFPHKTKMLICADPAQISINGVNLSAQA